MHIAYFLICPRKVASGTPCNYKKLGIDKVLHSVSYKKISKMSSSMSNITMKMEYGPFKSLPCPPRHRILFIWNEMKTDLFHGSDLFLDARSNNVHHASII